MCPYLSHTFFWCVLTCHTRFVDVSLLVTHILMCPYLSHTFCWCVPTCHTRFVDVSLLVTHILLMCPYFSHTFCWCVPTFHTRFVDVSLLVTHILLMCPYLSHTFCWCVPTCHTHFVDVSLTVTHILLMCRYLSHTFRSETNLNKKKCDTDVYMPISLNLHWSRMWLSQTSRTKKKVKWSHYRPAVAQKVFHDRSTRRRWVVSNMPRPHFTPGKDPVPILQEAGWAPGPV